MSDENARLTNMDDDYPGWEVCPTSELVPYDQLFTGEPEIWVDNCQQAFKAEILDRQHDVKLKDKMPVEYAENVISANEIYDTLNSKQSAEEKDNVCVEASDERTDARELYRNESNEAIIGNYFAKRSKIAFENEPDEAYKFYMQAIDLYYDAYAVSSLKQTYKNKTILYAGTCYFNIGQSENLPIDVREQAYMFSIALTNEYRTKSKEDTIALNHTIGTAYMKLCELSDDDSVKYYFNRKAEAEFEKDFANAGCGKKAKKAAAEELVYVEQYCYDHIDSSVYINETRNSVSKKHKKYLKML